MSTDFSGNTFRLAVSDKAENKLGSGGSAQRTSRCLYYYAERNGQGVISLQALNGKYFPSGRKKELTLEELIESYRPEPLLYYNKIKPVVDGVESDLEKGEKNLEGERADAAAKCFKRALEVDDENIRGLFGLGMAYLAAGKTEEAGELLGRIMDLEIAFDAAHSHLFNQFGIRMRKAGMLSQALDYYNKAIALNGEDEHLYFNLCRIHYEMSDFDAALGCVAKALHLNGEFPEGKKMLAYLIKMKPETACSLNEVHVMDVPINTTGLDLDGLPWENS
jgi:tetratricopeptide (TPR) repeat protein